MKIVNRIILSPLNDTYLDIYKDKEYIITAITVTIKRFGPSGSLKNENITLEHTRDVIPKISSEVFF
jgi:hypothetical protein